MVETMDGTFNGQILIDKLTKLNNSQQSIETLSHWCIFHRKKAKQVVETWDRQFHCSPKDQKISFLYLANDILQNSRRKGMEFVSEFWKVLPDALNDVIANGDDFGKKSALRLVDIWEDRKVFGMRNQPLKEELLGRTVGSSIRSIRKSSLQHKNSVDETLDRIVADYEVVYNTPFDEESLFGRCKAAIGCIEKAERDIDDISMAGATNAPQFVDELKRQNSVLGEYIEQLVATESSRTALVSHLREALQEQELKLGQVRDQLQVARVRSEQAHKKWQKLGGTNGQLVSDEKPNEASTFPSATPTTGGDRDAIPPGFLRPHTDGTSQNNIDSKNLAAAAAVPTNNTHPGHAMNYLISSFDGLVSSQATDYPEKRPKLENGPSIPYLPVPPASHLPPYRHPDLSQQRPTVAPVQQQSVISMFPQPQPPLPLSPPPPVPPPPPQYAQSGVVMTGLPPYDYGNPQSRASISGYPLMQEPGTGTASNPPSSFVTPNYFQTSNLGFYGRPLQPSLPPISRQ